MVKNLLAMREAWVQSQGWEDPLEEAILNSNPLQYSCLENPHGHRSLAGYSPWGHKESDVTEQLSTQIQKSSSTNQIWYIMLGRKENCIP